MRWFGSREKQYEQQLDDELRFHVERQIAEYVAEGISAREARRRVLIEFPSSDAAKKWFASPEYAKPLAMRQANSKGRLILMEGV